MHKPLSKKEIKELNKRTREYIAPDLEIVLLLQDVTDPVNVGSFFRLADAANVSRIVMTNNTPTPPNPRISMTSRGLERRITWQYFEKAEDAIEQIRKDGFDIVAVELTPTSQNYSKIKYKKKTCLILGNEASGVYKKILNLCDLSVHIPMLGKGPSLNVNMAASIVVYEIVSQFTL